MTLRWVAEHQYDEEGRPRPSTLITAAWPRPQAVEAREGLLWPVDAEAPGGPLVRPAPAMLTGFLALAGGDDAAFARYARRWGALGLCGCDLPYQHAGIESSLGEVCILRPDGVPDDVPEFPERIAAWRSYVDQAVRIVTAARLPRPLDRPDPVSRINDWMDGARVTLSVSREAGPRLHLGSGSLFGGLAVAMLSLVMGGDRLTVCAGCGRWFTPSGRQSVGRLWCGRDACQRAKRAAASRDYRRRRKEDPMRMLGVKGAWTLKSGN